MFNQLPEELNRLPSHVRLGIRSRFGDRVIETGKDGGAAERVGDGYSTVVGQYGEHLAVSNVPIVAVQWVVPPTGSPLVSYNVNPDSGVPSPLAQPPTINPLYFSWTAACATYVGVYITTAYGTGYVENYFYVTAPTMQSFTSVTGVPWVGDYQGQTLLRFGEAPGPGVQITATVACPNDLSGTIAFIQLASDQRFARTNDNASFHMSINGQFVLDVGPAAPWVFYQNEFGHVAQGQSGTIDITDAPAQGLNNNINLAAIGDGDPVVPESYQTYLMFLADPQPAMWVALGMLSWNWEGYTERNGGGWSAVEQPGNAVNPVGVAQSTLPTWSANTNSGQWVQGV